MAHFSDCGSQCSDLYCRQRDFLPLQCEGCGKDYCSLHFKFEAHGCAQGKAARSARDRRVIVCPLCSAAVPLPAGEDENAVWERHAASGSCRPAAAPAAKPRCPVQGCKEKLTSINSYTCGDCGMKVCMKHRFSDLHPCRPAGAGSSRDKRASCGSAAERRWSLQQAVGQLQRLVK
mmetsp:Transcript_42909/g.96885  ORF Transcript_42909/g.96885 Transcript_42909/m.96885 type:complete len:176 (+) Transcript_42909:91-618(+)